MTAFGLSPAKIRSLACVKCVSSRPLSGPEDDVEVEDDNCSRAESAACISVVMACILLGRDGQQLDRREREITGADR